MVGRKVACSRKAPQPRANKSQPSSMTKTPQKKVRAKCVQKTPKKKDTRPNARYRQTGSSRLKAEPDNRKPVAAVLEQMAPAQAASGPGIPCVYEQALDPSRLQETRSLLLVAASRMPENPAVLDGSSWSSGPSVRGLESGESEAATSDTCVGTDPASDYIAEEAQESEDGTEDPSQDSSGSDREKLLVEGARARRATARQHVVWLL